MKKSMLNTGLAVFLCTAGLTLAPALADTPTGEVVQGRRVSGPRSIQLTPEQLGLEMQKGQLDENALAALRAGQYASAEDNARQCIELGQDSGLAQEILASSLYAQGKSQAALQAYKEIADAGGKFPRNLIPYALLLLKSGQWAKAVTVYNQARNGVGDDSLPQLEGPFSIETPQPRELEAAIHIAQGLAGSTWVVRHWLKTR